MDGGCAAQGMAPAVARGRAILRILREAQTGTNHGLRLQTPSSTVVRQPERHGQRQLILECRKAWQQPWRPSVPGGWLSSPRALLGVLRARLGARRQHDSPIVLLGERKVDGSASRDHQLLRHWAQTCINLEASNYVAGRWVRARRWRLWRARGWRRYPQTSTNNGVAGLGNIGHGQNKDPFFTGQIRLVRDERCTGYDSGSGDGHGIYLSNGSDWNIARYNDEPTNTASSDFQINCGSHIPHAPTTAWPTTDSRSCGTAGWRAAARPGRAALPISC